MSLLVDDIDTENGFEVDLSVAIPGIQPGSSTICNNILIWKVDVFLSFDSIIMCVQPYNEDAYATHHIHDMSCT